MPKRKGKKKNQKSVFFSSLLRIFFNLLIVFSLWAALPYFLADTVNISGFEYMRATGSLMTNATLKNARYKDQHIVITMPEISIEGAAPLGQGLQLSASEGTVNISNKDSQIDAFRLNLDVQPLLTDVKSVEASFLFGEVLMIGSGRFYHFEKNNNRPISFWDCLIIATTPEGLKLAEGILQMPLEEHLASWKLPEDAIDGTAGEVVSAISGWFAKQVGKLITDYIFLEFTAKPDFELVRMSKISEEELNSQDFESAIRVLWSKQSGNC
tara:strand:+ start:3198 stop:4004 length:807 start_codon:yes stop_codon:yes gene_type:complete